ncbi:protein-disulfide reductase DsbD domain-containing protein, partial [Salmonella enterica]|uniref:protein-disulfide reductase DsbD domain-containing protein n=1 Tax=Salmonella enterica TaxID=28901 RepID=UPI00329A77D2
YRRRLNVPVTVNQAAPGATLTVTYQGCADAAFCYPPETKTVPLSEVAAAIGATPPPALTQTRETSKPAAQLP